MGVKNEVWQRASLCACQWQPGGPLLWTAVAGSEMPGVEGGEGDEAWVLARADNARVITGYDLTDASEPYVRALERWGSLLMGYAGHSL